MDTQTQTQNDEAVPSTKRAIAAAQLSDFQKYMPLVQRLAVRMGRKLPPNVLREDLVAAGSYGLVDALAKHKGEHDVRFLAYASIRIRGAMLDELRKQDWMSRRARAKMTEADEATVVRFEDLPEKEKDMVASEVNACDLVEEKHRDARLRAAVVRLPAREAEIIERHYFGAVPLQEIAVSMSVSQARVSQLHARATATLKTILSRAGEDCAA